jgi:CheY-like chemotaxis protein
MYKILFIEDEDNLREIVLSTLVFEDFEVCGCENGSEAIQYLRENAPDLILCDVMMPGINGYTVLAEVRGNPAIASIPFIFVTAKAEKEAAEAGLRLGANSYITKPFVFDELLTEIRRFLPG